MTKLTILKYTHTIAFYGIRCAVGIGLLSFNWSLSLMRILINSQSTKAGLGMPLIDNCFVKFHTAEKIPS